MEQHASSPNWFRIFLPLLFLLVVNISPRPLNFEKSLTLANWSTKRDNHSQAASNFAAAADRMPWRYDLLEKAGLNALEGNDPDQAAKWLREGRQGGRLSENGKIALANAHVLIGEKQAAIEIWEEMVRDGTASPEIFLQLIEEYENFGNYSRVMSLLRSWAAVQPENGFVKYRLGLYLSLDNLKESVIVLQQAAFLDTAVTTKVDDFIDHIHQVDPESDLAYRMVVIGRGLTALQEWNLAKEAFSRAVALRSDYAEAWAWLGEARQQLGQEGYSDLLDAQKINPSSILVQSLHALYWERQGFFDRALRYYQLLVKQEPTNPQWLIAQGELQVRMGDLYGALLDYQHATEIAPDNPLYWKKLAAFSLYHNVDVDSIGIPAARKAISLSPEDGEALDLFAQAMIAKEDLFTAEKLLLNALKYHPNYPPANLHLGLVYLEQGKTEQSIQYLVRAAELDPSGPTGEQAQRMLARYHP